jgi:hypothetical protein
MRTVALMAVLTAALLLPAGLARADDNSVYGAYVSRDADFTKLGKQVRRGLRIWKNSGNKRSGPALAALRDTRTAIGELSAAIEAEQASSTPGRHAKSAALASLRIFKREVTVAAAGVRAGTRGHRAKARRLLTQATRLARRSLAAQNRARRWFKKAGVQIKPASG